MANVIRQDIIEIGFDADLKSLTKIADDMSDLKKSVSNVGKEDGLEKLKDTANGLQKDVNKTKKSMQNLAKVSLTKLGKGLDKIGTGLTNIGKKSVGVAYTGLKRLAGISFKAMIVGIAGATAGIAKFADMASDLEETKNKIDVAFGSGKGVYDGAAKDVLEWSKTSTTSMGLAQQSALDTAALFGDMGTSMGLTKKEASNMSMALTQQAADLSSFKNMNIEEVTTALNGVFTGETESLKRLGVVMTQTNLEQYALSKGMGKSLKEMTEAEKVQLRYAYVMEKTKNATGEQLPLVA